MSSFFPFYVSSEVIPQPWMRGSMSHYTTESAWWNHAVVGNYASRFYSFTITFIRQIQNEVHINLASIMDELESRILSNAEDEYAIISDITTFSVNMGDKINNIWIALFKTLVTRFRDGYVISDTDKADISIRKMFYPRWWLESVGFFNTPPNPDAEILFAPNRIRSDENKRLQYGVVAAVLVSFMFGMGLGVSLTLTTNTNHKDYEIVDGRRHAPSERVSLLL
jgi:hypothetical protein